MNTIPSLILYNPLEAFLLLLACYFFGNSYSKFNIKKYIIHAYILGIICFIFQYPYVLIKSPVLFLIYDAFLGLILMPVILFVYNKIIPINISFVKCFIIFVSYYYSIVLIADLFSYPLSIDKTLWFEFYSNIIMKIIQFIFLFGVFYMKKTLINFAKNNITKSVACTGRGWGEPKLTEKLKAEIKK